MAGNNLVAMLRARKYWFAGAAVILVAALVWLLWPAPAPPAPRARQYLAFTACLLTPEQGVTDPVAAAAWAGLQDASLATHAKVEYLPIIGPQTVANAVTFANTLAQRQCGVIVAAGDIPSAAVEQVAPGYPRIRFYTVGGKPFSTTATPSAPASRAIRIDATSAAAIRGSVDRILTAAIPA